MVKPSLALVSRGRGKTRKAILAPYHVLQNTRRQLAPEAAVRLLRAATGVDDLIVELGTAGAPSLSEVQPATCAAGVAAPVEAGVVPTSSGPFPANMLPAALRSSQEADERLAGIPGEDRVFGVPEAPQRRDWQPGAAYLNQGGEVVDVPVLVADDAREKLVHRLGVGRSEPPELEASMLREEGPRKPSFMPDELFRRDRALHRPLTAFWGHEGLHERPPRLPATLGGAGLAKFPAAIFADRWRRHAGPFGGY